MTNTVVSIHPVKIFRIEHEASGIGPIEWIMRYSCKNADIFSGHKKDFLSVYAEPMDLTGPIGQFFGNAFAKTGECYNPITAPWFFGLVDCLDLNDFFSPSSLHRLDELGMRLMTYVPAPGQYLVEKGQAVFIKDQAVRIQSVSILEAAGLIPQQLAA